MENEPIINEFREWYKANFNPQQARDLLGRWTVAGAQAQILHSPQSQLPTGSNTVGIYFATNPNNVQQSGGTPFVDPPPIPAHNPYPIPAPPNTQTGYIRQQNHPNGSITGNVAQIRLTLHQTLNGMPRLIGYNAQQSPQSQLALWQSMFHPNISRQESVRRIIAYSAYVYDYAVAAHERSGQPPMPTFLTPVLGNYSHALFNVQQAGWANASHQTHYVIARTVYQWMQRPGLKVTREEFIRTMAGTLWQQNSLSSSPPTLPHPLIWNAYQHPYTVFGATRNP
jgi:hypothetical protein